MEVDRLLVNELEFELTQWGPSAKGSINEKFKLLRENFKCENHISKATKLLFPGGIKDYNIGDLGWERKAVGHKPGGWIRQTEKVLLSGPMF
ncbi:hypothetical protein FQA39_LY06326 [Lamprigera yunnana]|nr:hypothetical protein FQA39_LY06326 [Lamprigera yunnana]